MKKGKEKLSEELKTFFNANEIVIEVDIEDLEFSNAIELYDAISDKGGFDKEVITYVNAMNFLYEHDASLRESLSLASDYGFELENLNSETLASLLSTQMNKDKFLERLGVIDNIIKKHL